MALIPRSRVGITSLKPRSHTGIVPLACWYAVDSRVESKSWEQLSRYMRPEGPWQQLAAGISLRDHTISPTGSPAVIVGLPDPLLPITALGFR